MKKNNSLLYYFILVAFVFSIVLLYSSTSLANVRIEPSRIIINAIENKDFADQLPVLVAACWKNGLNYEEYTETFVQVFIEGDFQLAFDAFTVIDNIEKIKKQDAERCLIKLRNAFDDINDDKKRLITELINIINDKKVNPGT